jgi:hypothetical protein
MSALMLGSLELRNVPGDFDSPLGEPWSGWRYPPGVAAVPCDACNATGYSPIARGLFDAFYGRPTSGEASSWRGELLQEDVDALLAAGRFDVVCGRSLPTAAHPNGRWYRMRPPASADAVNAAQREQGALLGRFPLDGISVGIVVRRRCEALNVAVQCQVCDGEGHTFRDDEHRAAHDAWNPEPPTGDHIQLWETVSDGGPLSPVFPDSPSGRLALASWMTENGTSIESTLTQDEWLRLMAAESYVTEIATGALQTAGPAPTTTIPRHDVGSAR